MLPLRARVQSHKKCIACTAIALKPFLMLKRERSTPLKLELARTLRTNGGGFSFGVVPQAQFAVNG